MLREQLLEFAARDPCGPLQIVMEQTGQFRQQLGVARRTVERLLAAIGQACGTLEPVETGEREKRWRMRPTPITRAVAITAEEIAEIISKWTHIPVTRLMEGEKEKLPASQVHTEG